MKRIMADMSIETHTDSFSTLRKGHESAKSAAHAANPCARGRSWWRAMMRGAAARCPACGRGALYAGGLQVVNYCDHCREELYHQRAERLGPLFSAFLALNVAALAVFVADIAGDGALWPMIAAGGVTWILFFWLLLPAAKGMVIGLQWTWRLHGFQYAAMCRPHAPSRPPVTDRGRKDKTAVPARSPVRKPSTGA